jgi:hypothetical protein
MAGALGGGRALLNTTYDCGIALVRLASVERSGRSRVTAETVAVTAGHHGQPGAQG